MSNSVEIKIQELYDLIMSKPYEVLEIFNHYYGEDRVDIQSFPTFEKFKEYISISDIREILTCEVLDIRPSEYRELADKTLLTVPDNLIERVLEVLTDTSVVDYLGRTYFNGIFILVHFPIVKITNENDKFVYANHMYAKICVSYNGSMISRFTLNRAEYSYDHISSDYMHSHISGIPLNDFTRFLTPCLGSGPIRSTISNLNSEYDEDLWGLFCLELDKYIHTESIAGGPYRRLENIYTNNRRTNVLLSTDFKVIKHFINSNSFDKDMCKVFTRHLLMSKKLKFAYNSAGYSIGMSFRDYIITVSNVFIDWYNEAFNNGVYTYSLEELIRHNIVNKYKITSTKIIQEVSTRGTNYLIYNGKKVCTFKGKDVLVKITDSINTENVNTSILLNPDIALYILTKILYILNYKYGKQESTQEENRTNKKSKIL